MPGTSEIVESVEELDSESRKDRNDGQRHKVKPGPKYSIDDDINKLFEAIDIRNSRQVVKEASWKSAMKRPIRVGSSPGSGIGISEPMSLKQALRGLCISQASEMAAMKRLSKPSRLSEVSESGTIKRLYRAVVVEASESGHPLNEVKGNVVISLVPERSTPNFSEKVPESRHISTSTGEMSNQSACCSTLLEDASTGEAKMIETQSRDELIPLPTTITSEISETELGHSGQLSLTHLVSTHNSKKLPVLDEILPASVEVLTESVPQEKEKNVKLHSTSYLSGSKSVNKIIKPAGSIPRLMKPVFRNKSFVNKKIKQDLTSATSSSNQCDGCVDEDVGLSTHTVVCHTTDSASKNRSEETEKASPASSSTNISIEVSSTAINCCAGKPDLTSNWCRTRSIVTKADEKSKSRSREKGEFSQSSKSSIGEYSSSTTFSEESNLSGSSRSGYRPHMSKNLRWEAIYCVQKQHKSLGLRDFKLLRKLGGGDIGTVYLGELIGTNCLFALKVMDNEFLASRRKMSRAQTEKDILQMLDHPFLPTLYAHFITDKFSCLVTEYCPGGDLHVLRQKQPGKSFSEQAARFYVAEVLLALEYLHMLGVVYRDLKPENVMVREDGHIMLTDFDLSLICAVNPTLLRTSSPVAESPKRVSSPCSESSCIDPFCLHPSWQVPCFTTKFLSAAAKTRKLKSELASQVSPLPQLVVEPTSARSNSFVGTHEYLAPEIIKGEGHGSAVDWWTFGIFLYELLYGKTPFKGQGNDDALANVVSQCLQFPGSPIISSDGRDLIRRLLKKEPENRLGSAKGAAEIKQHSFFEGLNWALIRCAAPPELPKFCDFGNVIPDASLQNKENTKKDINSTAEDTEFEMF